MSFTDVFKKIFGTKADRDMKAIRPTLDKVLAAYAAIDPSLMTNSGKGVRPSKQRYRRQ